MSDAAADCGVVVVHTNTVYRGKWGKPLDPLPQQPLSKHWVDGTSILCSSPGSLPIEN